VRASSQACLDIHLNRHSCSSSASAAAPSRAPGALTLLALLVQKYRYIRISIDALRSGSGANWELYLALCDLIDCCAAVEATGVAGVEAADLKDTESFVRSLNRKVPALHDRMVQGWLLNTQA
jgi:hypothetical protein